MEELVFLTYQDQRELKDPRYYSCVDLEPCRHCAHRKKQSCPHKPDGTLECAGGIYLYQWEVEELIGVSRDTKETKDDTL